PTIKAQILRSAFILLSLVAICAIPFSLAQRNTTKRPGAAPNRYVPHSAATVRQATNLPGTPQIPQLPQRTSGARAAHVLPILPRPQAPQVVLYDQYDNS